MRAKTKKRLAEAGIGLLLGAGTVLGPGCSQPGEVVHTDPPPPYVTYYDEGAGSYPNYDYEYYPDWNVYYYPAGDIYYWYENGHWRTGARLPAGYTISGAHHERVHSRTRQPWGAEQKPFEGSGKPADEFGEQP